MIFPKPKSFETVLARVMRQWAPYFIAFGEETKVPAELIAAHCWRESRGGLALVPKGPTGKGDNGHGHGLMQIDDRHHAEFIGRVDENGVPLWTKPAENIGYATRAVIVPALEAFPESLPAAIAAYNASRERVQMALKRGDHPDTVTTHHDYVGEVLTNAQAWHASLTLDPSLCRCQLCTFTYGDSLC